MSTATGAISIDGWERGGVEALAAALLAAGAMWMKRTMIAAVAAGIAAAVVAVAVYQLPGTVLEDVAGASSATVAWGAGASLLGLLILAATALTRPSHR